MSSDIVKETGAEVPSSEPGVNPRTVSTREVV
jgi:hypothetical protein